MAKNKKNNQNDRVLKYLETYGSITSLEAFNNLGITRLSARIFDLRKTLIDSGLDITSERETSTNRYQEPTTYARYFLTKVKH